MPDSSLTGRLLVATPALRDPNFDRTVVLVLEHNDEGAAGVVLNRPSDLEVEGTLPDWHRIAADPPVVFIGGPVTPNAAICLARAHATVERGKLYRPLFEGFGTVDLNLPPDQTLLANVRIRVFAGYAGWIGGQLEAEIATGSWYVVDSDPDDPVVPDPDGLWPRVLRRQGGRLAVVASCPPDPTLN